MFLSLSYITPAPPLHAAQSAPLNSTPPTKKGRVEREREMPPPDFQRTVISVVAAVPCGGPSLHEIFAEGREQLPVIPCSTDPAPSSSPSAL